MLLYLAASLLCTSGSPYHSAKMHPSGIGSGNETRKYVPKTTGRDLANTEDLAVLLVRYTFRILVGRTFQSHPVPGCSNSHCS